MEMILARGGCLDRKSGPVSVWLASVVVFADLLIAYLGQHVWGDMLSVPDQAAGFRLAYLVRLAVALTLILVTVHRGKACWRDFGIDVLRFRADLFWSGRFFAVGLALFGLGTLFQGRPDHTPGALLLKPAAWFWLDSLVAFPVIEEVVYCSVFLAALKARFSARYAVFLSASIFCFLHVWAYGGGFYLPSIVLWLCLGLFLEGVYSRKRSLVANIFLHSGANLLLILWQDAYGPL